MKILKSVFAMSAITIIAAICHAQDATYQTKIYKDNGGDRLNIASGGSVTVYSGGQIEVQSGGDINIKTGGLLKSNGTTVFGSGTYWAVAQGGTGSNTAAGARDSFGIDFQTQSVTGTATIATTLGTVTVAVATLETIGSDTAYIQAVPSSGNVLISIYGTDTTTLSTTPVTVHVYAGGSS